MPPWVRRETARHCPVEHLLCVLVRYPCLRKRYDPKFQIRNLPLNELLNSKLPPIAETVLSMPIT